MTPSHSRASRVGPVCRPCRTRKLGCDRPRCTRCREASRTCIYEHEHRRDRASYRFVDATPSSAANRRHSATEPSLQLSPRLPTESGPTTIGISETRLAEIESRLEWLTNAVRATLTQPVPETSVTLTSQPQVIEDIAAGHTASAAENAAPYIGHLSVQGNGRARFMSEPFWANICDEVSAIDEMLREQTRYTGIAASSSTRSLPGFEMDLQNSAELGIVESSGISLFGDMLSALDDWDTGPNRSSRFQGAMPDIVSELPSKALCDQFFEHYVLYYHSVAPLVHMPSVRSTYDAFWQLDSHARRTKCAPRFPLITAILFAGAMTCNEDTMRQLSSIDKSKIVTGLHKLTAKTLRYANFPRTPTLDSFAAFLIIQNSSMKEEQPLTCCSYVGTAVRIAQMLGCNRDPSCFTSLTPVETEVRRRISWQVYYLDVLVAIAAGLPPLIDAHTWTVSPPCELRDDTIGTVEAVCYVRDVQAGIRPPESIEQSGSLVSCSGIMVAAKYHTIAISRSIISKLYEQSPITNRTLFDVLEELQHFEADMRARIDRLPRPSATSFQTNDGIYARWARLLLLALADRNWTYLYHPLCHAKDKQTWEEALNCVLRHSQSYLEKMTALTGLEEFVPLQWAWPGIHQPLHAIMVILRHLNNQPHSLNAGSQRQTIDEVIALCGPDGGLVGAQGGRLNRRRLTEGGHEVWHLIRKLRTQAWSKVGLEPDVLMTRDEVVDRYRRRVANGEEFELRSPSSEFSNLNLDTQATFGFDEDQQGLGTFDLDSHFDWFQWEQ